MGIVLFSQEPMIFSGTLRENLDPAGKCSDREMWEALDQVIFFFQTRHFPQPIVFLFKKVRLRKLCSTMVGGLDAGLGEGGSNLSAGQRQLICIARCFP